jgi:hypothetical protein
MSDGTEQRGHVDDIQRHHQCAGGPSGGHRHNHPLQVTVRTLAGHHVSEALRPDDTVAELTAKTVKQFVAKSKLVPGDYALTLPRLAVKPSSTRPRPCAMRVVEGDVLVLVSHKPHVDG